jgi:ribosomal protein L39E
MASRKAKARSSKKRHLDRSKRQTKWAPFWTVIRKFGKGSGRGKQIHPSRITHIKRAWQRNKLKIKPRKLKKKHLG